MCGIIGVASRRPVEDRNWLVVGRDAMAHRGPDDCGVYWSATGHVGLGHRRLSILDLSASGHQPMACPSGDVQLVFNGEIYNFPELRVELETKGHVFHSQSDTEVVLAAYREWGVDCLPRLNGMFAIGIYDRLRNRVLLARDRAGEKPLFYTIREGALTFASELKGLMANPAIERKIDPVALDCYLAMGYSPGGMCILEGVAKLPPAHALLFDVEQGEGAEYRYWELPDYTPTGASEDDLLDELEELLEDSVRRQLVADVSVGVLLSGGVDSSLVTAMAVRAKPDVKTFTIRFPGHGSYDETEHARLIARHFGTDHLELEAGESTVELLPHLARQFDEPMVDSSMVPTYLVSRLIREHCTVALGGDGGDELFAGYPLYSRLLWMQHQSRYVPRAVRKVASAAGSALLPVGFRGRIWLQGLDTHWDHGLPLIAALFDPATRLRLLSGRARAMTGAESIRQSRIPESEDLLQRATRMDFSNYLAEDILVKVDRASMLNSLEVRAPLLDYRLIEFAFQRVPSHLKASRTTRKVLLKNLVERVLPDDFDKHRKQGFSIPLASWLEQGPWQSFFRDTLLGSSESIFNKHEVERLFSGQKKGMVNGERLFSLVLFELWRREYGAHL